MRTRNHLPFSIGGTLGAAAGAGALAGLEEHQYRDLLSYAAQQASGVMTYARDTEHIEKAFIFGGMTGRNGVTAATMVQMGFTGVFDTFDGDGNFLLAYSDNPRPEQLIAELGERYEVMLTNIRKYCVGFHIQSALEGLTLIIGEHSLKAADVDRIVVRIPESGAHTVNDRDMPDINLQYIFAVTLLDGGSLSFAAAHSFERMTDPTVVDLKFRVTLIGDPELTRARPEGQSNVEVFTRDGNKLEQRVATFKGKSDNPLTSDEIAEKTTELMTPVLGAGRTKQLIETIAHLENLGSVRDLRPLLSA